MITQKQLEKIVPPARAARFLGFLNDAMHEFGIDTPPRIAAFVAQCAHESGRFGQLVESMNYSSGGLQLTFPTRLSPADCARLGRQPGESSVPLRRQQEIANRVYGGRLGNGNYASGDGWTFRGRGLIQTTGRDNYRAASIGLYGDHRLLDKPELLERPADACRSAALFWSSRGLNRLADAGDMRALTKAINGGANGLDDRVALFGAVRDAIA